jgi:alpha-galactosidase
MMGKDHEMAIAADWAQAFCAPPEGRKTKAETKLLPEVLKPPFSFVFGSRNSAELLPGWKCDVNTSDLDSMRKQQAVTYTDPQTGLTVRAVATLFKDFPAVEWVLYFKNTGPSDTPILEDIQALDSTLRSPDGDPVLHYARGATCSMDDFMPITRIIYPKDRVHVQPGGGRSSSDFLPFFNLEAKEEGVVLAIGWSGEWATTFTRDAGPGANLRLSAGMALTHLRLHPGEEIRTPRIALLFWQGEHLRGNNLLRQFILAYHRPSAGGRPVNMPLCNGSWGGTPAAQHLENIRQLLAHHLPMDYYWIDAEWFGKGEWWANPGNWEIKKDLYPQGFKPLSDVLHASGRKLLLWFEPERVCEGTPWSQELRDWLLEVPKEKRVFRGFVSPEGDVSVADPAWVRNESNRNQFRANDRLLNLGIPEARQFLTDFISSKIEEFGLDCYRHDANIAPLEFWRAADAPDRQGITEIRWVEGFYAYWDELLRRHPQLIIDDCASGGRRIDLETLSRSLPLWRTDFALNDTANQCHTYGLLYWVPLNSTSVGNPGLDDNYRLRSGMSSGLQFDLYYFGNPSEERKNRERVSWERARRALEQYRSIQKYFYGDYYPLTQYSQADDAWMAYQLDLADAGEGVVVVLKRPLSSYTHAVFALHALQKDASYELTNLDTHQKKTFSGSELMDKGLEVQLLNKPDSGVFCYRRLMSRNRRPNE